jgi:hypothetical protein
LPAEEVSAMAERSRSRVSEQFSLNSMKTKTLAVYDELLQTELRKSFLHSSRS